MPRLYTRWFAIAFLSQVCFVLANTLMAHYARWVEFLEGDVGEVGLVMGVGPVVGLLSRPWLGQWINRLGARTSWGLGYVIFCLGVAGNLLLHDLGWPIYVLRSAMVMGSAFVFASSLTYITQMAPVERRTEAIGTLGVGGFLGMLLGPVLGDLILGSSTRSAGDFAFLFTVTLVTMVTPMALLFFLKSPSRRRETRQVRLRDFFSAVRSHWPGAVLWVNLAFGVCMSVPFGFLASFIDDRGLAIPGLSVIGLFFFSYAGWGALLRITLRRVPDRFGRRKVLFVGMFFMTLGMFTFPLVTADQAWLIILPGLICGTGHSLVFHTMTALTLQRFPPELHGTGAALTLMMLDMGMVAGAPLLGLLARHWGYNAMFWAIGSFCVVIGAFYAFSLRRENPWARIDMADWEPVSQASAADDRSPTAAERKPRRAG